MAVEIAANIRRGNIIEYTDGQLYSVLKAESFRPGKGTPTTTIEMRRISDGIKIVNTYKTTDKLEKAFVEDIGYTYLYQDGDNYVFMHPETFEQVHVAGTMLGDNAAFLQENMEVNLQIFNDVLRLRDAAGPHHGDDFAETEPVVKGQTASSSYKPAILDNGVRVMVPPHIDVGTRIIVNTEDNTYLERAKD
jgi:elongation factor P